MLLIDKTSFEAGRHRWQVGGRQGEKSFRGSVINTGKNIFPDGISPTQQPGSHGRRKRVPNSAESTWLKD
jgi:hypothetical protein